MGECHNCRTGKQIMVGDKISINQDKTLLIQGFRNPAVVADGVSPDYRVAIVTVEPGSILRDFSVHDTLFYQLV